VLVPDPDGDRTRTYTGSNCGEASVMLSLPAFEELWEGKKLDPDGG
jgi:hypothetical protein